MATFDCRFLKSLCTLFGMRIRVQQFCLNCLLMYMYVCVCVMSCYMSRHVWDGLDVHQPAVLTLIMFGMAHFLFPDHPNGCPRMLHMKKQRMRRKRSKRRLDVVGLDVLFFPPGWSKLKNWDRIMSHQC